MKKQILCALSVAALAATMLTVPVYAADQIRVEGENYQSDQNWTINKSVGNCGVNINDMLKDCGFLFLNCGKDKYDPNRDAKPSAAYTFSVDKAGIYDLEYAANYMKETTGDFMYLSPFSVTLNDDKISFEDDILKNTNMTSYTAPGSPNDYLGTYKLPVYLKQGENKITFTVEGTTPKQNLYTFYLDYFQFTYDEEATTSGVQVEAEELTAGNLPNADAQLVKLSSVDASNGAYYQFNNTKKSDGYLEYIVPASAAGEYQLTLAGSHTDSDDRLEGWVGDYAIVINDDDSSKISVGSTDGQPTDVETVNHWENTLDTMVAKENVTLKKGLNKVKVLLDRAATNGNHVIHLDYLKFTPVQVLKVEKEFEPFGGDYEKGSGTAEFTATGLDLGDLSKLVFKSEIVDVATYKYIKLETTTSDDGSVNLAVRLTNIPSEVTNIKLGVADFEVE